MLLAGPSRTLLLSSRTHRSSPLKLLQCSVGAEVEVLPETSAEAAADNEVAVATIIIEVVKINRTRIKIIEHQDRSPIRRDPKPVQMFQLVPALVTGRKGKMRLTVQIR